MVELILEIINGNFIIIMILFLIMIIEIMIVVDSFSEFIVNVKKKNFLNNYIRLE